MDISTYKRVLLKISGESLMGSRAFGIDVDVVSSISNQVKSIRDRDVEVAIVVGGGNMWRGATAEEAGMDRATADYAGMLATVINGLAMQDGLEQAGVTTRIQTAITIQAVAEPYIRRRAIRHMEKGRVVIFVAGTGNPYVTTDTAAALRSIEVGADILLMAKNQVDGVYDADPNAVKEAQKYEKLTYMEALNQRLGIMDSTALSLCMENDLPIIVFDLFSKGSLNNILDGSSEGTYIGG
ncbi:MAG: UMP kinase [Chloroflexota bacterium]|nr:UMP kinase [Chloroflexota bacterium]